MPFLLIKRSEAVPYRSTQTNAESHGQVDGEACEKKQEMKKGPASVATPIGRFRIQSNQLRRQDQRHKEG